MIVYAAGLYASGFGPGLNEFLKLTLERQHYAFALYRDQLSKLESYHYMKPKYVDLMRRFGHTIFLDSGAFSAMSLGITINIKHYAKYIHDHKDIIHSASVLDAVGDAHQTYLNQRELESLGCAVLPCFHFGEDLKWLSYYLDNYEHITIGGMVPISNTELRKWLDRIWASHLSRPDGKSRVKVHGFGLTSLDLIDRYPWYSVDSTRWIMQAAFGAMLHPSFGPQLYVTVSDESPQRKRKGASYHTKPALEKQRIEEILESEGFSVDDMRKEKAYRGLLNLLCFVRLEEKLKDVTTITHQTNELF